MTETCNASFWRWAWHTTFGHPWDRRRVYFGAPDLYVEYQGCYRKG